VAKNVKLLAEVGFNQRMQDGLDTQNLNKTTLAVAFAPDTNFWTRPELRLYVTRVNWNDAAKGSVGLADRNGVTLAGIQLEAWW
jgi:maltoporin